MPASPSRLLVLRVAAKLLGLAAGGALLYMLVASIVPPGDREGPSLTIPMSDLPPGEVQRLKWGTRRILVLRRTPQMMAALKDENGSLADGESSASQQPESARNAFRSVDPRVFVALDYDPEFGCPLELAGPEARVPVSPWRGGFHDVCRGSWYDLAGRVYREQPSHRNLMIPPYTVESDRIIVRK